MRGLNLRSFKKVGGDDSHSVMQHEDGHQIKILHKPLSPKMKKGLMDLPVAKMADGGDPDPQPSKGPYIDPKKAKEVESGATEPGWSRIKEGLQNAKKELGFAEGGQVKKYAAGNYVEPAVEETPAEAMEALHRTDSTPAVTIPTPQSTPTTPGEGFNQTIGGDILDIASSDIPNPPQYTQPQGSSVPPESPKPGSSATPVQTPVTNQTSPMDIYNGAQSTYINNLAQGANEEIGGKFAEAKALGEQGRQEAASLQNSNNYMQHIYNTGRDHMDKVQGEIDAVVDDINNNHIDPNHYIGSTDTAGKLATGIGLLLSGFGSGLTHGPNMAMEFLNKQIERDIDAQKSELGKKENLVSAYMRQYGNIKDSTSMAMATQGRLLENQLMQAASTAKDPIAQARALQAAGEIHQKYAQIPVQVAKNQALIQLTQQASGQPAKGTQLLRMLQVSDPEAAKEWSKKAISDGKGGTEFSTHDVTPEDRSRFESLNLLDTNAKDLLRGLQNKSSWSLKDRAIMEQKAIALQSAVREGQLNTVYKKGEQPLLDKAVSENPISWTSRILGTEPAKLQELIEGNQRALNAHRVNLGLPPVATINFTPK